MFRPKSWCTSHDGDNHHVPCSACQVYILYIIYVGFICLCLFIGLVDSKEGGPIFINY